MRGTRGRKEVCTYQRQNQGKPPGFPLGNGAGAETDSGSQTSQSPQSPHPLPGSHLPPAAFTSSPSWKLSLPGSRDRPAGPEGGRKMDGHSPANRQERACKAPTNAHGDTCFHVNNHRQHLPGGGVGALWARCPPSAAAAPCGTRKESPPHHPGLSSPRLGPSWGEDAESSTWRCGGKRGAGSQGLILRFLERNLEPLEFWEWA